MMTTLKTALTVTLGAVAAVAAAGISPARAIAPCPQLVPAFSAFPLSGTRAVVPRNVVVLLYRRQKASLTLREKRTKKKVPFRLVTVPGAIIARMIPLRPLKPSTAYVVRGVHGGPYRKYPYTLTTFTTSRTIDRSKPPMLRSARVAFTAIRKPRYFRTVMVSGGGRSASIKFTPGSQKPAAVELDIALLPAGRGPAVRSRLYYAYYPLIYFARPSACPTWVPRSLNHGRYIVKVTPWSATGRKGKTLILKGRIK